MTKICPTACTNLLNNHNVVLLDIREKFEYDSVHLEGLHIPMAEVTNHLEELRKYEKIVVMCQSGKRAEALVNFLETEFGMTNLIQMEGGILGWIEKVDNSLKIE